MNVFIATSTNPYYNLAVENWLFRKKLYSTPILYLWKNNPCIIIGRAQNPWREANLKSLRNDGIKLVRRQSGGGAVYHDLGNLNYTFMSPKSFYDKNKNLEFIKTVLWGLDVYAYISNRNDIMVRQGEHDFKISGSAFRETKNAAFHHGTLLFDANVTKLYDYLHQPLDKSFEFRGVASHRSKVVNLKQINSNCTMEYFINTVIKKVGVKPVYLSDHCNNEYITQEMNKLVSWEWKYGKTLPFTQEIALGGKDSMIINVQQGNIKSIQLTIANKVSNLDNINLIYDFTSINNLCKMHNILSLYKDALYAKLPDSV